MFEIGIEHCFVFNKQLFSQLLGIVVGIVEPARVVWVDTRSEHVGVNDPIVLKDKQDVKDNRQDGDNRKEHELKFGWVSFHHEFGIFDIECLDVLVYFLNTHFCIPVAIFGLFLLTHHITSCRPSKHTISHNKIIIANNRQTKEKYHPRVGFLLKLACGWNIIWVDTKRRHELVCPELTHRHEHKEQTNCVERHDLHP